MDKTRVTSTAHRTGRLSAMVVKTIAIFSGVQVITILCSLVRGKLVSLWLGPAGIGLFGLFNNAFEMLTGIFQLGIRTSAVRDVASQRDDIASVSRIGYIIGRWAWGVGLIGALATMVLAPLLSQITFGDNSQTVGFIILSAAVLFSSLTNTPLVIMQGMGQYKRLASATVWGAVSGLLISIPMYRWLGLNSIAPSFVAYAFSVYLFSRLYHKQLPRPIPRPTGRECWREGLGFIKLGIFLTISGVLMVIANYAITIYLNWREGTDAVGYYQAGYTIVSRYAGLIFTAIVMEYYPRLVTVIKSQQRTSTFVSHEMIICVAAIVPIAVTMMIFDRTILSLLYNGEFEVTASYLNWSLAGTVLRAVSWCIAVEILARGDSKAYLLTETVSNILFVTLSICGNELWGLSGMGVAYFVWYLAYTLLVSFVYFKRYRLKLRRGAIILSVIGTIVILLSALVRNADIQWPLIIVAVITAGFGLRIIRRLLR